jgi:hypothetical protein
MNNKKDVPLNLLKAIEEVAQKNLDLIQVKREENTYYSFLENDDTSQNFFKIFINGSKRIGNFDPKNLAFEYKPASDERVTAMLTQGSFEDIKTKFEAWIKLIREIHETPSVYDDNFTNYYSDYYFNEFQVYEEDANIFPFAPNQQVIIEKYLLSLSEVINNSGESIDDITKSELVTEIVEINRLLTVTTKNQVMKKITTVFGKLFKVSKPIAQEIIKEAGKQLLKKLIELGINYAPTLLENLK